MNGYLLLLLVLQVDITFCKCCSCGDTDPCPWLLYSRFEYGRDCSYSASSPHTHH